MKITKSRANDILHWLDDNTADHTLPFDEMTHYHDAAALIRQLQAEVQDAWHAGLDAGREQGRAKITPSSPEAPPMTADVELLPLPEEEWNVRYGYYADAMREYARANAAHATAPLQAEIEALRVEVAAQRTRADAVAGEAFKHEGRAERLAEALRIAEAALADIGDADREPGDDVAWCERRAALGLRRVRDALRDHGQEADNG